MANLPIVKKNTELQNINKNLSIVNRLLPTVELQSSFNKLAWWNTLSQGWKCAFWGELNISEIEFNKKPDFYLEKLFNTTTELWFDYELVDFYKIQDISPLGNLTQLTTLIFWGECQIQDISALGNLIKLKKLHLSENKIQNISSLGNLTQLTSLDLEYNQIQDISVLRHLTQLISLDLRHNQIQDISVLSNLIQLTELNLLGNEIQGISALRHLTQLISLDLGRNQIQDISPLGTLENLETLHLGGNPISQPNIDWLQSKLPNCWIIY